MTTAHNRALILRTRAEAVLQEAPRSHALPSNARDLISELLRYQHELQQQNEQLRETQLQLETSRARSRDLFELAPVACLTLNTETQILEANKAAGVLLGHRPAALLGRRLSTMLAREHVDLFERHRRTVLSPVGRDACTLDLVLADGDRRELRVESMRTGEGSQLLWRVALSDVTEMHRLQRQLVHAQKLEAIGAMASGVAHDVGNLLMAISACAEMALSRIDPEHPAHDTIAELRRGALHGRSAVAQLLTFARKSEPRTELVELHAALREHEPLLRALLGGEIALELDLRAGESRIRIEAALIEQILLNLATNARHAMPRGGRVRITTRYLAPDAMGRSARAELGPRACVLLEVSDSGGGMEDQVRARAFEPFFTTKPPGVGTGLGLSMVYGAVRQGGGHCELESRLGEGTAVRMYWPLAESEDCSTSGTYRVVELGGGTKTVLLVEDDRLVRLAIRHYLERAGYRVLDFASGEPALAALRENREAVHLLLSDVVLPGLKGPEIMNAAQAIRPELRVLLISAHPPELLVERGWLQAGMCFLRKPFTAEELSSALRRHLAADLAIVEL